MKKSKLLLRAVLPVTALLYAAFITSSYADNGKVTPYGDYCRDCGSYGTCKEILSPHEALNALSGYYREKGYQVGTIRHKGRFIEADIYKNEKQVDKVLFDRKTGRVRSVY